MLGGGVVLSTLLASCESFRTQEQPNEVARVEPVDQRVSFEKDVKPIFEGICVHCHNGSVAAGDLDLRNRELAFRSSPNGPFLVPGYPDRSKIFDMIVLGDADPGAMPPTGHRLEEREIALIKGWIEQGADWPEGEAGNITATSDMEWRSR